ncbi:S-formylglutathione hydrolase FrmB [Actinopolyspora xinjiangensis]|uniref:S-formylglutathione hydrolase FrmB n=1 Tax=Actinopolyspora xinjiangensis TaxID=405564 RepID=A0A1H0USW8_9ACTN|nr:alpha/beta hydrolase family protein [Actinopolyspora xinjiangensis]SDP68988.1 S-formylglutathione hydrolase FrmB [Actinopolyspora xinjiangensis]
MSIRRTVRGSGRLLAVLLVLVLAQVPVATRTGVAVPSGDTGPDSELFSAEPPLWSESGHLGGEEPADNGARIVSRRWLGKRTLDLAIQSPSLADIGMVRVLLPRGWRSQKSRDWPVLYLLHGCCEPADYRSWTEFTDVRRFTADKPVMVVMPSDGAAGMYSQWRNFGLATVPDWETFHLTEVRQILERNYRAGHRRAVAGISIGGFGAMHYAFRHPDMFRAAASYSGMLHTTGPFVPEIIKGILIREGYYDWRALWGDDRVSRELWRSHNPHSNVGALRGTDLYVSAGSGLSGPLDPGPKLDVLESASLYTSKFFVRALREEGVPVTTHFYNRGTHSWPYWQRELHRSWSMLTRDLYR